MLTSLKQVAGDRNIRLLPYSIDRSRAKDGRQVLRMIPARRTDRRTTTSADINRPGVEFVMTTTVRCRMFNVAGRLHLRNDGQKLKLIPKIDYTGDLGPSERMTSQDNEIPSEGIPIRTKESKLKSAKWVENRKFLHTKTALSVYSHTGSTGPGCNNTTLVTWVVLVRYECILIAYSAILQFLADRTDGYSVTSIGLSVCRLWRYMYCG